MAIGFHPLFLVSSVPKNNLSFSWFYPSLLCFYLQNSASRYQKDNERVTSCRSNVRNKFDQCCIPLFCCESASAQPDYKFFNSTWPCLPPWAWEELCLLHSTGGFESQHFLYAYCKQARELPAENERQKFLQSRWFFNFCSQSLQNYVIFSDPASP